MLFSYVFVPHPLDTLETWTEHLVKEVWCKPQKRFRIGLLTPALQQVVRESRKNAREQDYLWTPIKTIHNICRDGLSPAQRSDLARWFDNNNDIEGLCSGRNGVSPVTYEMIRQINEQLASELEAFFTNLWTKVRHLKPVMDRLGTLADHYSKFKDINLKICPFCGLARLEGRYSDVQDDYDHYLPKDKYAFNAISMKNLAPICDKCNKKFKLRQDPLHKEDGSRRKAFYVFATQDPKIELRITVISVNGLPVNPSKLRPENILVDISAPGQEEELEGWKEVFRIEDRYKDLCCEDGAGGYYWLEQVLGEMKYRGQSPAEALATVRRAASASKWADANFLKLPFLDGCQKAGFIR
jgi:5-methylcytosine-specific restriction endonuclease McrA